MINTQKNSIEMTRAFRILPLVLAALFTLTFGICAPAIWAYDDNGNEDEIPFDEAHLFFELNNTDGDLGIHALIDGDAWKKLEIEDPNDRKMLDVRVKGRLSKQGLTEFFFESAEPTFDELDPVDFFKRFPAGEYEIEGLTLEGEELESEVLLTHVLPAPPQNATVSDAENSYAFPVSSEECDEDDLPTIRGDVTVAWDPVTSAHPDLGDSDAPIEIIRYQAVAEWEGDEGTFVASFDLLPPDAEDEAEQMSVTFPESFFEACTEVKFEILVREESYNQTAIESCPFIYDYSEDCDDEEEDEE